MKAHWRWWALAALVAAACCALGLWQLGRAQQKRAMLTAAAEAAHARTPVPLASAADAGLATQIQWTGGTGRFATGAALVLDGQVREGRGSGVKLYRVFVPEGGITPVLVDLGWLPLGGDRSQMPTLPAPDLTQVQGLLVPLPSSGLRKPLLQPLPNGDVLATSLSVPGLASRLGQPALAPRILRLDPAIAVGGERDLDVLPNTMPPERHIAYAVQWFALAATVLILVSLLTRKRRPRHDIAA